MIGKINFKNTVENLVIAIAVFLIGAYVGHLYTIKSVNTTLDNETIKEEINKPTTEVVNNTDNTTNIKKIKAKNDSQISTLLENKNDSKAELNSVFDTLITNDDMWCLPIEKLSKRTKRLIEKDLK